MREIFFVKFNFVDEHSFSSFHLCYQITDFMDFNVKSKLILLVASGEYFFTSFLSYKGNLKVIMHQNDTLIVTQRSYEKIKSYKYYRIQVKLFIKNFMTRMRKSKTFHFLT